MAIDRYLDALSVAKRTRYNYRGNIGTLMNYAKERGYLSHDFPGLLKVGKRKKFPRKVQVFTPEEMGKLLHGAKPDVALPLAITAFAGVRAEEVKKLERRHFNLVKGYIAVPADIAKNKTRRLVPIVPNLRLWLERLLPEDGLVCVYKNLSNQYLKAASKLGVTWRRNGLRHSFVSYRTADVENIPQVAMESGHTVKELQTDYLEVVDKDAAKLWFSLCPAAPTNIVTMPSPASPADSVARPNGTAP
jgi:integrase